MSFMFLENYSYKKSVWLFLSTGATQYCFISQYSERFSMQFALFLAVY